MSQGESAEVEWYGSSYIEHNHPFLKRLLQDVREVIPSIERSLKEAYESLRPLPELVVSLDKINQLTRNAAKLFNQIDELYQNFFEILKTAETRQKEQKGQLKKLHKDTQELRSKIFDVQVALKDLKKTKRSKKAKKKRGARKGFPRRARKR